MTEVLLNPNQKGNASQSSEKPHFSKIGKLIIKISGGRVKEQKQIDNIMIIITGVSFTLAILITVFFIL